MRCVISIQYTYESSSNKHFRAAENPDCITAKDWKGFLSGMAFLNILLAI